MVAFYRPDLFLGCAFNADPNDPAAPAPIWTDLTARLRHADSIKRGRQYELDQNQTGQPTVVLWDPDEYLNPGNTAAVPPFAGNVVPYRQILMQAVWPNPCSGNLLNASAVPVGYDPSFETTPVGSTPPNMLAFNTSPTVQAAAPFTGTKSLQWSVAGNSTEQVTGFTIPCVPGRPYIASVYYRQTAANTAVIFINGGAPGATTTTATGTYVRLSVAFVATQPTHQLYVGSYTPTLASTVNIDAIQLEQPAPLNANPAFETAATNWTAHGGTIGLSKVWQQQGQYSLLLTPNGVSSQCYAESEQVPVTAGAPYLVAGWAYSPTGVSGGLFTFNVNWYTAAHAYLSTSSTGISLTAGVVTERDDQFTAPAGAAYATVAPTISGTPPTSRQVYVDNVALYPATPSTFTTAGSVIYPVMRDYVERWPSEWDPDSAGFAGLAEITCVDALAVLQSVDLHTEFRGALLSKQPDYWWPLGDGQNATAFAETSGNGGVPLNRMDAPAGPAPTFTPGTQVAIAGDPGTTGVTIAGGDPTVLNGPETVLATGIRNTPLTSVGWSSRPAGITVMLYLSHTDPKVFTQTIYPILISDPSFANYIYLAFQGATGAAGQMQALILPLVGTNYLYTSHTDTWSDGKPHLFIVTISVGTSTGHINMWVDGVQVGASGEISTSDWLNALTMGVVQVGGGINPLNSRNNPPLPNGIYNHLAIWNRELSAQDVTDLWTAAKGYAGEKSGARVARYLDYAYNGTTVVDTGASTMGPASVTENTAALAAIQQAALSENGNFWVDASGQPTFRARTVRYLATTSKYTFGENTAAGEIPYLGDLKYDYDPTYVYNDVTVTRTGGIVAGATDVTSQKRYFKRSYQRQIDVASDLETIDAANYLLNQHKTPSQRVEHITLDPSSNPAVWPVVLSLEVGTRVTVKRRAKAANAGTGLTMSADYFVESIEHGSIDMDAGTWTTTLLLSPVDLSQVWILGDATYGVLGVSTILGY